MPLTFYCNPKGKGLFSLNAVVMLIRHVHYLKTMIAKRHKSRVKTKNELAKITTKLIFY